MDYEEIVEKIKVEIKLFETKILAQVKIDLTDPPVVIKGLTIKRNTKENKVFVSPPSYFARYKMHPIIWMPKDLWIMICNKVLREYSKMTGESIPEDEIDISEMDL